MAKDGSGTICPTCGHGRFELVEVSQIKHLRADRELLDETLKLSEQQSERIAALEKDAARYRWLRHGDNDKQALRHLRNDRGTVWILRNEDLDAAMDAARLDASGALKRSSAESALDGASHE